MTSRRTFLRSLLSTSALIAGGLSLTHIVPAETRAVEWPYKAPSSALTELRRVLIDSGSLAQFPGALRAPAA